MIDAQAEWYQIGTSRMSQILRTQNQTPDISRVRQSKFSFRAKIGTGHMMNKMPSDPLKIKAPQTNSGQHVIQEILFLQFG